jgi:cytochrome P450
MRAWLRTSETSLRQIHRNALQRSGGMKIDLLSPASFAAGHPFAQYRWLRENAPVFWHKENDGGKGFWAVTRYQDVWNVDRDFQTYSSEPTIMISDPAAEASQGFGGYKMIVL